MRSTSARLVLGSSLLLLGAASLGAAQDPSARPFVCAPDGSATLVLPAGHAGSHAGSEALSLYERDRGNRVLECADGRSGSPDPIAVSCHFDHSRTFSLGSSAGTVEVHALGTRHDVTSGSTASVHEEVVLVDAQGHAVHTLVQWQQDVSDDATHVLRRRFKVADADRSGDDELCIESVTEVGPGRAEIARAHRFRPSRRSVGVDAFRWDGERFVRAESLDGGCPRSGYQLFVAMPGGIDPVAARRDVR